MNAAELQIALHRRDTESYNLDLGFTQPNSNADVRPACGELEPFHSKQGDLLRTTDPTEHGLALVQALFVETKVQTAFEKAVTTAQSLDVPLRVLSTFTDANEA